MLGLLQGGGPLAEKSILEGIYRDDSTSEDEDQGEECTH